MHEKTVHLLTTELLTADGYLERIFNSLTDGSELAQGERATELAGSAWCEINVLLTEQLLHPTLSHHPNSMPLDCHDVKERIKRSTKLLQGVLWLDLDHEATIRLVVEYINLLYQTAYHLHHLCYQRANLVIPYPRINMIRPLPATKSQPQEGHPQGKSSINQYHLPLEIIVSFDDDKDDDNISSLEWQRQRRYDQLLKKGQQSIQLQKYPEALEFFLQAKRFLDSAEINTLIAWCYSLTNDINKAKSYCLTAINLDPDYGPPYNDLGSYLLSEGYAQESIEWFDRAKQAANYQSREFPYINAGRAYIALNDIKNALKEFNLALELVPHNEELQQTVNKLHAKYQQWRVDNYTSPGHLLDGE
jgi:Tfp pilus assembly protein PilF